MNYSQWYASGALYIDKNFSLTKKGIYFYLKSKLLKRHI